MLRTALQLKHYHLTRLDIELTDGHEISLEEPYPDFKDANFSAHVNVGVAPDQAGVYRLALTLSANPESKVEFPYRFVIGAEGLLTYTGKEEGTARDELVAIHGAGMLYGALREMLLGLTLRFPHGPVLLPSVNFFDLRSTAPKPEAAAIPGEKATKKAPRRGKVAAK